MRVECGSEGAKWKETKYKDGNEEREEKEINSRRGILRES